MGKKDPGDSLDYAVTYTIKDLAVSINFVISDRKDVRSGTKTRLVCWGLEGARGEVSPSWSPVRLGLVRWSKVLC